MSDEQKEPEAAADNTSVVSIDRSPLSIGQKNYMKKFFNKHEDQVFDKLSTHKKEVAQIFHDYSKQVAESVSKHNSETIKSMNEALAKTDKKFSGMYGVLVQKFLVKQEEKVYLCELGVQAVLEITAESLIEILKIADEATDKFKEDFQKRVEDRITSLNEQMQVEAQAKQAQAEEGKENAEAPKEVVEQPVAEETKVPDSV